MSASERFRFESISFVEIALLFFRFLGHVSYNIKEIFLGRLSISGFHLLTAMYHSGAKLVLPLTLVSSLICVSIVLNVYHNISSINFQQKVIFIAQNILFYDLLPYLISLALSIQWALNLVNSRFKRIQRTPQQVLLVYVIPLIFGTIVCAPLLYIYCLNAVYISIYLSFRYLSNTNLNEYLFQITNTFTRLTILHSILKTLLYCTMVSLIVGYYYYGVAEGYLSTRKAISRIVTRSFIFLVMISVYFKFLNE